MKDDQSREVWTCRFTVDGGQTSAVLTVFKHQGLNCVNTSLPASQAAEKCALAMAELPSFGIPTPRLLGRAVHGRQSAVLCARIESLDWRPAARLEAARILARLHGLAISGLSGELRHLVEISDPRESRTTGGRAPRSEFRTLVHGDFFSANILPVRVGVCIIDWETLGLGDPMWDLGFLVGADRDMAAGEAEAAIEAYAEDAPIDTDVLSWHRQHWSDYWRKRGY